MTRKMPWESISTPDYDYNVLLVPDLDAIPVYWGRDTTGRCLLIVELLGDHNSQFRKDKITVNGIDVDLRQNAGSAEQRLVLSLEKHVDQDLFLGLCETLLASLAPVKEPAVALALTIAHLKRWKAFLSGRDPRLLSPEEVRGLFAELQFLHTLVDGRLEERAAVEAWFGPARVQQDFIFGNVAVEIKSLSGRERRSVRISSEDQLESVTDNLFLNVFRLSASDADTAISLNQIVKRILDTLTDSDAMEHFAASLATYGYTHMIEYDNPRFIVSGSQAYRVTEGFPRIVRSGLVPGLARVSYDIELEAMERFKCSTDEIFVEA